MLIPLPILVGFPSKNCPAGRTVDYCTRLTWIMHNACHTPPMTWTNVQSGRYSVAVPYRRDDPGLVMISRMNPDGLHTTPGYHHVTVVTTGRTAYLAGQCPLDPEGSLVGPDDLDVQVDQVVANTLVALAAVGAGPEQVIRTVIYVVSDQRAVLGEVWQRLRGGPLAAAFTSASTLLGVAQLGFSGQLVELDVTAALP